MLSNGVLYIAIHAFVYELHIEMHHHIVLNYKYQYNQHMLLNQHSYRALLVMCPALPYKEFPSQEPSTSGFEVPDFPYM